MFELPEVTVRISTVKIRYGCPVHRQEGPPQLEVVLQTRVTS